MQVPMLQALHLALQCLQQSDLHGLLAWGQLEARPSLGIHDSCCKCDSPRERKGKVVSCWQIGLLRKGCFVQVA